MSSTTKLARSRTPRGRFDALRNVAQIVRGRECHFSSTGVASVALLHAPTTQRIVRVAKKHSRIRAQFRKNRTPRTREKDLTRKFAQDWFEDHDPAQGERVSGKGELTRKRTVVGAEVSADEAGLTIAPQIDTRVSRRGRVLCVQGLESRVEADSGEAYRCVTRGLLKTLQTDQRHVLATGDLVWFRPEGDQRGVIERIEPRHGVLSRTSRGRQHVLVANVDQVVIVASAAEPQLKPNLVDRLIVTAEKNSVRPIICINKVDLVDPASLQPFIGVLSQLGYTVLATSVKTGLAIERLRRAMVGKASVVTGQSGVGKSSILNSIDPALELRVQQVSVESQKGRHTTSAAQLLPLKPSGYVVDTPGIRQFQLWDVVPQEVAGFYREIRPYVSKCRFPDCTHTHEVDCCVKGAVADGRIDPRRYESYVQLQRGEVD
jgi:ribosome biogenesis GTPase / thiamine phosphate phosphatase